MNPASDADFALTRVAPLLDSDPAAAAHAAGRILHAHPDHPGALLLLAAAHRRCGDPQAAVAEFSALARAQPQSAVIRLEFGRTLRAAGSDSAARAELERAVELAPALAEAWRELSLVHAACGEAAACDAAYARFEKASSQEARLPEAATALANERLDAAETLLQSAVKLSGEDALALRLLAQVAAAREDYVRAERLLERCLCIAPGYSRARLELVRILFRQGKGEPMLPLLERLLSSDPGNHDYGTMQAVAYRLLGRTQSATRILEGQLLEVPRSEVVWLNYGHTLRAAGRGDEAADAYRKCVEFNPQFSSAWVALADLKTYRFSAADIAAMQAQLARAELRHEDRAQLEFALGKAREDERDFAAAFDHYARGNALRRSVVNYDSAKITRFVQRARSLYSREFLAARAGWGCPSPEPVFIVGLPRAGSTLIEQILASHPQVEGTRELTDVQGFALELGDREDEPGRPPAYPQSLERLTHAELAALGERYLAQTRAHRLLGRPHFIDKMGSNFLHVGLIHLMLPNARIIDARRAALGCCVANFKQHFYRGAWFTYSLEDLGRYYRDYVSLMAHFDQTLPGRVHRVCYEDLVADLEGEVRRLLDYCGLPFAASCLRFHETQRAVQTVSSEQVRRPLYTEAVDQWRNFEPWLDPLKQALGELAAATSARRAGGR